MSEQRALGLGLLAAVVGLSLGLVYLNVQFNTWYNDFYNTMQEKRAEDFWPLIGWFTFLAFVYIWAAVYRLYLRQMLEIEWRKWLNERYLQDWLGERAYYKLQLLARATDNPDQRIAEDLRLFVQLTLQLGLGLLGSGHARHVRHDSLDALRRARDRRHFHSRLHGVGGSRVRDPRHMGHAQDRQAAHRAGVRPAAGRSRLPLLAGSAAGKQRGRRALPGKPRSSPIFERFANVITNWWNIMRKQKQLGFFTISYDQLAIIFPLVVAAPRYFRARSGSAA